MALRYGTCSQEISQFYLHTPHTSANGMNHTCLCLPSRSWYSFTDRGGMEGWVGLRWLVGYMGGWLVLRSSQSCCTLWLVIPSAVQSLTTRDWGIGVMARLIVECCHVPRSCHCEVVAAAKVWWWWWWSSGELTRCTITPSLLTVRCHKRYRITPTWPDCHTNNQYR